MKMQRKNDDNNYRLDHISYAVKSTDDSIKAFSSIYPRVLAYRVFEKSQNVFITYLTDEEENHKIELVEPIDTPNILEGILGSNDSVLYHVCWC